MRPWRPALGAPPIRPWHPTQPRLPIFRRMKSLEQDALRAQMVLSKSQEGRSKRGPLERLAEAPSPAPTPSPTPLEGLYVQTGQGAWPAVWTPPNAHFLSPQTSAPRAAPPPDVW